MDTRQITRILMADEYVKPHFVSVCAHDQLNHYISHASVHRQTAAIVFNLDPIHLPGSHWVAAFLDFNNYAEYFDSTGKPPDPACSELLQRVCSHKTFKYNNLTLQDSTQVCGQFCVVFLKLRCRGYTFEQCIKELDFKHNDRYVHDLVQDYIPNLPFKI